MRWALFAAGLLGVVVLAEGVLWRFPVVSRLDLFLVYALVCALFARAPEAALAGWVVGFVQDLGSEGPVGIHAFTLGLAAWILTRLRETFNVRVWWPRGLAMLMAAFPAGVLLGLHRYYWSTGGGDVGLFGLLFEALWTALLAAAVAVALTSLPGVAIDSRRRFYAGSAMRG